MKYISLLARILISIPFLGASYYFYQLNVYGVQKQNSTVHFKETEGTVVESRVQKIRTSKRYRYEPKITYAYSVNGLAYTSDRLGFGGAKPEVSNNERGAKKWVVEFPVGRSVKVFYNPKNPAESVLTRKQISGSGIAYFIVGLGTFFLLIIFAPWVKRYVF